MVSHECVTQQHHLFGFHSTLQQFEVEFTVFIRKKDVLAVIPALGHMVHISWDYEPGLSRHAYNVSRAVFLFHQNAGITQMTKQRGQYNQVREFERRILCCERLFD